MKKKSTLLRKEELPVGKPLITTIHIKENNSRELRYPVIYREGFYTQGSGFFMFGQEEYGLWPDSCTVLCGVEFPEPYNPETITESSTDDEDDLWVWHPIKEDMPKEDMPPVGKAIIVTVHETFSNRTLLKYPVTYRQGIYSSEYNFYQEGIEENVLSPEWNQILAWTEIPKEKLLHGVK